MSRSRPSLAAHGPTAGDRIRLADSDLWVRVAEDRQAQGDQPMWGYARTMRRGMAQQDRHGGASELDTVVLGAVVLDPAIGCVKADIGIKDGRIVGVGRAGNPDISDGIELPIGPHTEPVIAYGLIATPGIVDSHVHLIHPGLLPAALSAGVTTLITAGFEEPPASMRRTLGSLEAWPLNVGLQVNARAGGDAALLPLLEAGACGFKIHEDYGADPELIDATLTFAASHDVSVSLHTDGLHESAELEDTVAAIGGRTVHAYHVEGAGGGHVPDLIGLVREANIICSSTTPTIPFGPSAAAEHLPMIMLNHGGRWNVPADLSLMAERIHPASMAAEGPLHELGAISIINSDSQGMGRIGETLRRTVQLAHVMKEWRRSEASAGLADLPDDGDDDTARVLRYLAKVTAEPAITHGIAEHVGSLRPGRLADIVLWRPGWFGVKPELVLKSGYPAWGSLGDGNATVEGAQPTRSRGHWGALGLAPAAVAVTFVSGAAPTTDLERRLGTRRRLIAVHGTRRLTRAHLLLNRATAPVDVDLGDGSVTLEGKLLAVPPATELPLGRRYWLR
ncbi:MAG: urease subunit alpha [Chloroflexota bacterium]|nr:urease subunit alpha [Chloroflexota bacterium]